MEIKSDIMLANSESSEVASRPGASEWRAGGGHLRGKLTEEQRREAHGRVQGDYLWALRRACVGGDLP